MTRSRAIPAPGLVAVLACMLAVPAVAPAKGRCEKVHLENAQLVDGLPLRAGDACLRDDGTLAFGVLARDFAILGGLATVPAGSEVTRSYGGGGYSCAAGEQCLQLKPREHYGRDEPRTLVVAGLRLWDGGLISFRWRPAGDEAGYGVHAASLIVEGDLMQPVPLGGAMLRDHVEIEFRRVGAAVHHEVLQGTLARAGPLPGLPRPQFPAQTRFTRNGRDLGRVKVGSRDFWADGGVTEPCVLRDGGSGDCRVLDGGVADR
jgi:hypothetical protein